MIDETQVKKIVSEVLKCIDLQDRAKSGTVPTGVSNRHIHLSPQDQETLFGAGYQLKKLKDLSQPGQFAAEECVTIAGEKGAISKVRILGPVRGSTQIEVSVTDCFQLGIPICIRDSGDIKGSPRGVVIGPKGAVNLTHGFIVASRHMHAHPDDAARLGLKDLDKVSIKAGGPRSIVFGNVLVRVSEKFALDFHLDCDEANAAGLKNGDLVEILV